MGGNGNRVMMYVSMSSERRLLVEDTGGKSMEDKMV